MAVEPKVARLKTLLMNTGLQQKDNKLFQVIDQLISALLQNQAATTEAIASGGGGGGPDLSGKPFLTHNSTTGLSDYRRLIAGDNVTFDDSVANERTIDVSAAGTEWDVLTNGDATYPELIFADGDVIMLEL